MSVKKNQAPPRQVDWSALLAPENAAELRAVARTIASQPEGVRTFERAFNARNLAGEKDWQGSPDDEAFARTIRASHAELLAFLGSMMPGQRVSTILTFINHGSEQTVESSTQHPMAGRVLWDRWNGTLDEPVIAFAAIAPLFDQKEYRYEAKPAAIPDPPLYPYHPERFQAFHACAEQIGKIFRHKVDACSGMLTIELLNELIRPVVDEMNHKGMRYPRKLKAAVSASPLVMESMQHLMTAYGRFVQAGRHIIDFPPSLLDLLARTEVDDIPLNAIRMPYAAQYLHFGPQPDLELEAGWLVDGAYVEARGEAGDGCFTVTAVPTDRKLSRLWFEIPEPYYRQDLVGDYRTSDLATAIDSQLSDRLNELNQRLDQPRGDITEQLAAGLSEKGQAMPDGLKVIDISSKMAEERLLQVHRRHPVYLAAMRLVVNALCYVTAYPDDIATVWPTGTPEAQKTKASTGQGKEVMRARSQLAALGYVPVLLCGQQVEEQRQRSGASASPGAGHPVTHWRRGHWRNQAHGPGRSLHKLIWVMPMLVGHHQPDEPESGHLYRVSPEDS